MKKPFLFFASVILATLSYGAVVSLWAESSVVAASSVVKLYMSPASAGLTTGYTTSLQLRLYINTSAKIDYADARVSFSTANLEVVSISKQGSYFNYGSGPSVSYNNSNGLISVTGSGPVLNSPADVVLATVVVKGKVAGSGAISYTTDSQVGDITSGGHVKDALTSRVGATINVSNPPASSPTSGSTSTGSGNPAASPAAPTATTPTAAPTAAPDSGSSTSTAATTPNNTADSTSNAPSSDVATAIKDTVSTPPVWLKFLLPATALVGVIGAGSLGYVLYAKRRQKDVSLPDDLGINEVMPSTEQEAEEAPVPAFATSVVGEVQNENMETVDQEQPETATDLPTEAEQPLEGPAPSSLESVLSQPPELMPDEMKTIPDQYTEPVMASELPLPEPPVVDNIPTQTDMPASQAGPEALPTASAAPAPQPTTPPIPEVAPIAAPAPTIPVAAPVMPAAYAPMPPIETVPSSQPLPAMEPSIQTLAETDYKNMPDMYELAEQRINKALPGDPAPAAAKPQTV